MTNESKAMEALKLPPTFLGNIDQRLSELVATDAGVPALAYSGEVNAGPGCGCKGSCIGGCTSW